MVLPPTPLQARGSESLGQSLGQKNGPRRDMRITGFFVTVRAARLQNETAPEKFLNRSEKRFEKREKGSEKRSEMRLKNV